MTSAEHSPGIVHKLKQELKQFLVIFLFLAGFFCTFTTYRLLTMKEVGISYVHYGFALLEALIMAKVILLGSHIRASKIVDDRPLIIPTLYKVLFFGLFITVFEVFEHVIESAIHHKGPADALREMASTGLYELLARVLMVVCAFVPFFALTEIARVHGEGYLLRLFFRSRGPLKPVTGEHAP